MVKVSRQMAQCGVLAACDCWLEEGLDKDSAEGPGESVRSISSSPDEAEETLNALKLRDLTFNILK